MRKNFVYIGKCTLVTSKPGIILGALDALGNIVKERYYSKLKESFRIGAIYSFESEETSEKLTISFGTRRYEGEFKDGLKIEQWRAADLIEQTNKVRANSERRFAQQKLTTDLKDLHIIYLALNYWQQKSFEEQVINYLRKGEWCKK